jgi:hypothetical protein
MKNRAIFSLQLAACVAAASVPLMAGEFVATPEPASILLMGGGVAALILMARRKRARK